MKKTLLVIICLLLLYPLSIGESSEDWIVDGYKWAKMPRSWKVGFIDGWLEGGRVVLQQLEGDFYHYFMS